MEKDGMKLSIYHYPKMKRAWLLKREGGEYSQHAHFFTKKEAEKCRRMIDLGQYPREEKYKIAIKRILTEEEFSQLRKKPGYYNRPMCKH